MKNGILRLITVALLLGLGPLAANAERVPFDNHLYEVFVSDGISWDAANAAAEALIVNGVPGHLATITSEDEDEFIDGLRLATPGINTSGFFDSELWIGGFQDTSISECMGENGSAEPGCGWKWVNNEGPISTEDFPEETYENWGPGEPNNSGGNEDHLATGLNGVFQWNDEGALSGIWGYVVEWDTVEFTPEECTGAGCQSSPGQTIILPDNVVGDGTITFDTVTVVDDKGCGDFVGQEDKVYDIPGVGLDTGSDNDLRLKWYMCGEPSFVVVVSQFDDVEVPVGTVEVQNDPAVAGVTSFGCEIPIPAEDDPPALDNPLEQDLVITQSTDPSEEVSGGAEEVTFDCGSSRGRYRGGSFLPIGVYFDFGIDYDTNPDGVETALVSLTREKFQRLIVAIENADMAGALPKSRDVTRMTNMARTAIMDLDAGLPENALDKVNNLLKFIDRARYETDINEPFNYNGLHQRMVLNLKYMLEVKVIPYAP